MARTLALTLLALVAACRSGEKPPEFGGAWPKYDVGEGPVDTAWLDDVRIPPHLAALPEEEEYSVAGACRALGGDHAAYAGAASGLIELGEPVVPYVGHFGGLHPALRPRLFVVLGSVFREVTPDHVAKHFLSPYEIVRTAAADSVGERRLAGPAPQLVDLLDDDSADVRRAAIASLRAIYNRFFGYRPLDGADRRSGPASEWRAHVRTG